HTLTTYVRYSHVIPLLSTCRHRRYCTPGADFMSRSGGLLIKGAPHGPRRHTTVCQLHMRFFKDGDSLTLEPWRAAAFPVVRDLVVDRSAFDRIIQAGGYITAPTGSAPDANAILVGKEAADTAFDAAACI